MAKTQSRASARFLRIALRAVISILFIVIALGVFTALKNSKPTPEQLAHEDTPRMVRTVRATPGEVPRWWAGYASVAPINEAEIAAEITAVVIDRPAWLRAGAEVSQGQVLLTLDSSDYESRLAQADAVIGATEANLDALDTETESLDEQIALARESVDLIQWELDQLLEARKVGGSSHVEIERMRRQLAGARSNEEALQERRRSVPSRRALLQSNLAGAQADRSLAEMNVRRCTIRAPFDGVIQFVTADRGERVNAGQVVLRIVDTQHLEVPVRIPAAAAADITVGAPAEVTPTSMGSGTTSAAVSRISPEVDSQTRTITVFIEVDLTSISDADPTLLPGQFVRARVRASTQQIATLVPRSAIDNDRVFVIGADSRAEPRDVEVGYFVNDDHPELDPHETQWAAVVSGLAPGEQIITSNLDEIVSGMLIEPADTSEGGER